MSAEKDRAKVHRLTETAEIGWMYNWWLAMGGHCDDFPGKVLETLTEPQKFQLIAELNRARAEDTGPE